jgi:hypothetical protein
MKRVINQDKKEDIVDIENVCKYNYYGFILGSDSPGYISGDCVLWNKESYNARFFHNMTGGNKWLSNDAPTLKDCIKNLMKKSPDAEIFEFNSYQELFEWASNQ